MSLAFFILQAQQTADVKNKIAENSAKFTQLDPIGIGMTLIGMAVVFCSLILLYLLFMNITKLLNKTSKKSEETSKQSGKVSFKKQDEIIAAISFALHQQFEEIHDTESAVLTINKVARTYSPWSSKIYMLRQLPRF